MLQVESHAHKSWLPKFTFNGRPIFNCALVVQIWRANGRANSPGSTKSRPQFWPSKFSRGMGGQSSPSLVAHHELPTMVAQNFWQPIYHALCTSTKPTAIWLSTAHTPPSPCDSFHPFLRQSASRGKEIYAHIALRQFPFLCAPTHTREEKEIYARCGLAYAIRGSAMSVHYARPRKGYKKTPPQRGEAQPLYVHALVISLCSTYEWTYPLWG